MRKEGMLGTTSSSTKAKEVGVYVGIQQMEYGGMSAPYLSSIGPFTATGGPFSVAAGRLSFTYGFNGPSVRCYDRKRLPCLGRSTSLYVIGRRVVHVEPSWISNLHSMWKMSTMKVASRLLSQCFIYYLKINKKVHIGHISFCKHEHNILLADEHRHCVLLHSGGY